MDFSLKLLGKILLLLAGVLFTVAIFMFGSKPIDEDIVTVACYIGNIGLIPLVPGVALLLLGKKFDKE